MSTTTEASKTVHLPVRNLNWGQGLTIALGVPVLILPSISTFAGYIGVFAIVVWMLSVFQGFMQNLAYGELASRYPNASGLPGFAQAVFRGDGEKYGIGKFIGGFSAWGYWFAWNPVLAIFSMTIAQYMMAMIPGFDQFNDKVLSVSVGVVIFLILILINRTGVTGGAALGYILAALSLIPLFVISISAFVSGHFDMANITTEVFPSTWNWDFNGIIMFFGIMAMAQWSACAWETAAIYAPLYKNPKKDIPKALFGCGLVCIFSYFLVQTACTGVLGVSGIMSDENVLAPMLGLAKITMGQAGAVISIIMLLTAMVLIIQTALLGSSSAMAGMAEEGNLPKFFGRRNRHGVPIVAMFSVSLLNVLLIILGSPASILAASALGYVFANGIALFSYVKAYRGFRNMPDDGNVFHAPKGWIVMAFIFGILNIPFYLAGITLINLSGYGIVDTLIGVVILACFVPLWFYSKYENRKKA